MKQIMMTVLVSLVSLSVYAGPINLESLSFLYTEQDLGLTSVGTYDANNPTEANKVRVFGSLPGLLPVNSGTQYNSSYLGYDINNVGLMWLTDSLDLYATVFNGTYTPVKLVDGSVIRNIGSNQPFDEINGLLSYNVDQSVGSFDEIGSPYADPNLPPIESYIYGDVQSINDFSIDCLTLGACGYDIAGMQYFDSKDDGYFNGDLFYVSKDESGRIKDSAIYAYNLGVNEREIAFTFEDLLITDDIAPTRGMAFFSQNDLTLPEQPPVVEVSEPGTLGILSLGTIGIVGHAMKRGALKGLCLNKVTCVVIDTVKKTVVGTAKIKK